VEIEEASAVLWRQFHEEPWFAAIGRGRTSDGQGFIVLYVKRRAPLIDRLIGPKWMGHDLVVVVSGPIGPVGPGR